eukprot:CAMPEP_0204374006 /NCGR_PEP_ID=MMETSP0469-20131031/48402_1 /ASSEMBLY_ACC=CAM_ASM_000384 /TAXON_ID=2969 /ORGANISM="Oxyrrhis marina" /LENGTH=552 /DNA_ID=CAMNT_0051364541 /DNA_START=1 /DNA_END=1659 /DNA_ORIENTATION=-
MPKKTSPSSSPTPAAKAASPTGGSTFDAGDDVVIFFRLSEANPKYQCMAVMSKQQGIYRPRIGLSDGWMPARVVRPFDPAKFEVKDPTTWVQVRYLWRIFFDKRGHMLDCGDDEEAIEDQFTPDRIKKPAVGVVSPRCCWVPQFPPMLGLIVFRWGARNQCQWSQQWGSTGSSVSDQYIDCLIRQGVFTELGMNFEVWTVWIEESKDLETITAACQHIFSPSHPVRRCKHVGALYHLYPTGFDERCEPNLETGGDEGAAHVHAESLFALMQAMERNSIPTVFPHPSTLYRLLASKSWTHHLAGVPMYKLPSTVALNTATLRTDLSRAATRVLETLQRVKEQQAGSKQPPITKGVVKLGYSWEALDVKFFDGHEGLMQTLDEIGNAVYIDDYLCGQAHSNDALLVQEYIPNDLELRLYVVENKVEELMYTKFEKINSDNDFKEFREIPKQECIDEWLEGDAEALANAQNQCMEAIDHYMAYLEGQTCEQVPAVRFDFFIKRTGPGTAMIRIGEICEVGFSMFGASDLPGKVFGALVRSMLRRPQLDMDGSTAA